MQWRDRWQPHTYVAHSSRNPSKSTRQGKQKPRRHSDWAAVSHKLATFVHHAFLMKSHCVDCYLQTCLHLWTSNAMTVWLRWFRWPSQHLEHNLSRQGTARAGATRWEQRWSWNKTYKSYIKKLLNWSQNESRIYIHPSVRDQNIKLASCTTATFCFSNPDQ